MLWICVLLPDLPLEVFTRAHAARSDDTSPLRFAITTRGHHPRIVMANDAARSGGIAAEQLVSAAYALAPDLVLRERDLAAERTALHGVAAWLTQFTPTVSIANIPAVLADIGGSIKLFGGRSALLHHIVHGVETLGFRVRLACAPTPTAARFLARAGQCRIVTNPDDLGQALDALPLACLDAEAHAVALLRTAGVTTFGEACALPRDALAHRVGRAFLDVLDRARAVVPDPQTPFVSPARYEGSVVLPAPISDVEALGFAVNRLVHELAGWLLGRGLGVNALAIDLEHERHIGKRTGIAATRVEFALASPARDTTHLMAVLRERLARIALPAPVETVRLTSTTTSPLAGRNLPLLPGEDVTSTVPLIDRLRARLGEEAVTCVTTLDDHRPERAWQFDGVHARDGRTCPLPSAPRPLWLLTEPQPLGATLAIKPWILRDGPERIEAGWWDGGDVRRDYYIAESPRGEMLWIYRDSVVAPDGEWFLHGIFA